MPGLSGLDTLLKIKQVNNDLPVIMITKSEEEHIMNEAIGGKIADYLIKPVNPNQILLSLKKALDNKRLVSEKTNTDYRKEFGKIGMTINDNLNWEEWAEVYKKIIYWELEMDALLAAPDKNTAQGMRDYILLLFLYNTGARADEVANLTIADLNLAHAKNRDLSTVLIKGKGNKLRRCPLWMQTTNMLSKIIQNRDGQEQVFLNRYKEPLTRFGIYNMVKRYVKKITEQIPSLIKKRISPHTVRHTTATHLLQAGVDINTIRAWLGHVSINTTNIYAEVDLEMKARALAHCEIVESQKQPTHWRDNKKLMSFLDSI
jgi:site-specific recombinase XerD